MRSKKSETEKQPAAGEYHTSVLLHESIQALNIRPDGVYVDATFGGGGHAAEILKQLGQQGRLIGFDQDEDAWRNKLNDERFTLVRSNFRMVKKQLRMLQALPVDGILADLGVSSWQFNTASRGFSYRYEGPLDMRMNRDTGQSAADVLNSYSSERLQHVFSAFGELRNAKTLAQAIVEARKQRPFVTTADLGGVCETHRIGEKHKYLAQVFQAVRIEVNDELGALREFLMQAWEGLNRGGRLAVITFHSLEDRMVKNFFKYGTFVGEPLKDMYGNAEQKWKVITKKPITASREEQEQNSRSRSAKLRVAEKI